MIRKIWYVMCAGKKVGRTVDIAVQWGHDPGKNRSFKCRIIHFGNNKMCDSGLMNNSSFTNEKELSELKTKEQIGKLAQTWGSTDSIDPSFLQVLAKLLLCR